MLPASVVLWSPVAYELRLRGALFVLMLLDEALFRYSSVNNHFFRSLTWPRLTRGAARIDKSISANGHVVDLEKLIVLMERNLLCTMF